MHLLFVWKTGNLQAGDDVTLDYCPFAATAQTRLAVLAPYLLDHLAHPPLEADDLDTYDDMAPLRRAEPDFAPPP